MATTTCKPAAEPVLPLVRTVTENVQSRDTFCLTPERFRRHLFDMPTMQPQRAMTAAGKSEIMRGYQEIFCDACFQPLSFKSRSESASRGSNPPGAANTILRKSFVKSLNERDVAFTLRALPAALCLALWDFVRTRHLYKEDNEI